MAEKYVPPALRNRQEEGKYVPLALRGKPQENIENTLKQRTPIKIDNQKSRWHNVRTYKPLQQIKSEEPPCKKPASTQLLPGINDKCLKEISNGDIPIVERIILILNGSLFLPIRDEIISFVGGGVPKSYLDKQPGSTCFKELEEEYGMFVKDEKKGNIFLSCIAKKKGCPLILYALDISLDDVVFKSVKTKWETSDFTLFPIKDKDNVNSLGEKIQISIQTENKPCFRYMEYKNERDPEFLYMNDKSMLPQNAYIEKNNNEIALRFDRNPQLKPGEKITLKELNKEVTGYNDTKWIYRQDNSCSVKYKPYHSGLVFGNTFYDNIKSQFGVKIYSVFNNTRLFDLLQDPTQHAKECKNNCQISELMNDIYGSICGIMGQTHLFRSHGIKFGGFTEEELIEKYSKYKTKYLAAKKI